MDNSTLKQCLEKLECYFTWDLAQHQHDLQRMKRNMQDVDQETCAWPVHYYNLLGYIQQTLDSSTEALMSLHKAESVIQEKGTEEAGVRLQVNKANLAWVYFLSGQTDKSKEYLDEVERLQRMHPAPPGCTLHPEVSGEKGWTLVKFDLLKRHKSVHYFRMALKAEPERNEWHKGLVFAMKTEFVPPKFNPDEIVEQMKIAHEKNPNDLFIHAHYLLKLTKNNERKTEGEMEREMEGLAEKSLETEKLPCLEIILRYYSQRGSLDKAIQIAETAHERFPSSVKALKHLADCYKWKVYQMEDSKEKDTLARKSIELYEEDLIHRPDAYKVKIDLASLYCYLHNIKKADEIYQDLLSEKKGVSPHTQQQIFYSYAQHLNYNKRSSDSVFFHMKVAEIPDMTSHKQKSIKVLESIVERGRDPRCRDIAHFLEGIETPDSNRKYKL